MFHLYQHHDLGALAAMLAALRERAGAGGVLTPETVVVPNRGTARWLQAELAGHEGIAANLDLPVPGRFVWRVLRDSLPGDPDSTDYERERLVWHLYALLPAVEVPSVQRYLAQEPRERQRYQLALRLADVFDAYLVHRRDVLTAWESGNEASEPPADWQAPIWRALVARLGPRHRARLLAECLERAGDARLDTSRLPDPVYAFGLVDLPPDYLRLIHALGAHVDVHFLLPNPSAAYWGDTPRQPVRSAAFAAVTGPTHEGGDHPATDEPAHPLLASLGRAGRDSLRVLYSGELERIAEPDLGSALAYEPPEGAGLLHRIQAGLIQGEAGVSSDGVAAGDRSLQIHACHGPLREVQVLHDRLLDLMRHWPELEARRIAVLVPDMARYAPAIHSVFAAADGPRHIPYSVADRPRRDGHPIARTFEQLVELPLSRWTASEVLALAGVPAVMRRFGLDESDLERLHRWVPAAGVRWGLDADNRAAAGGARFEQNSWRFGLDRLLLGLSQRAEDTLVDGVAPWSDLEGGSAAAVGRLWALVERLRTWRDRLSEPADAATWQARLSAMAGDLFGTDVDDPAEAGALATVHEAVAVLEPAAASMGDEPLEWEAVREALLGALAGGASRQPLVTGGVTFCGLEPLRGVPFDVVCLLGLDDGVFPSQDGQREFSLLQKYPRLGDPSVRDSERMAFLQALMGARRCLYVSYTGRSVTDGEPLQPSPVVGELIDFLHGHCFAGWARADCWAALVTEQPMHPFSPRYFPVDDGPLFTYAAEWHAAAEAQLGPRTDPVPFVDGTRLAPPPEAGAAIELGELQRFWRHPARWFFQWRLQVPFATAAQKIDDDEPYALAGPSRHALRERLFATAQREGLEQVPLEPTALERARGHLPPPPLDGPEFAVQAEAVNAMLSLHWRWQSHPDDVSDHDLAVTLDDGTHLVAHVAALGATELRRLRPGPLHTSHLLGWWLEYLAAAASGHECRLRVAGVDGDVGDERVATVTAAQARAYLADAIAHFREGAARPLLFDARLAEHYLDERDKTSQGTGEAKTADEALDRTNGWLSNTFQPPWQASDPWLRPLLDPMPRPLGATAAESSLAAAAEAIVAPLRSHLEPVEDDA